ncbi:lysozyme inhibitor LprI family protein [Achromobacter xylosoxidans]|uniref:lysozyme inhibitor LprI family protein n=1 Tax=Alcaligenes xylosoxydans xylosoxydans TaxID=85698 RepID=UPI000B48E109|nr:lysozyme inhibitor LprI family protein [Achromobacter xylosoxidans]
MKSGFFAGRLLCTAGFFALAAPAHAIDCGKAGSAVEKLICSDRKTVAADAELNRAYSAILKQAPDADIRAMLAHNQKRWLLARDQALANLLEDPGSVPAGKTAAGIARDLIRDRTAQFKETRKGAALPDMISLAVSQQQFQAQFTGGAYAGYSTSCDILPGEHAYYGCFATRHYQNKDRICSVDEYWASGSVYTKRYVANVVDGKPKLAASCSFSSSDEACSDTAGETKWNMKPQQPDFSYPAKPLPKIDGEIVSDDDYEWARACLTGAAYPAAN